MECTIDERPRRRRPWTAKRYAELRTYACLLRFGALLVYRQDPAGCGDTLPLCSCAAFFKGSLDRAVGR